MERFDVICRTCNTERSNLVNLLSTAPVNDALQLRDVLFTVCPSLTIQDNDRLPQQICYFCAKQLEIAYKFQLQSRKSHDELWKLVADTIKEEPEQHLSLVNNEDLQKNEAYEDNSCTEEEIEDGLTTLSENLEFLDEDDEMEKNYDECEQAEEITEVEDNPQHSINMEPLPSMENDAAIMCCHCDNKFFTANGLRLHEKLAHKNLKPVLIKAEILTIECTYCLQVFERKSELILHCRIEHRNELADELTCNICQKTFSGKNKFDHHLLYHAKHQYQCTVKDCKRAFIIKYKLTDHMKRFHGITLSINETRALKPCTNEES